MIFCFNEDYAIEGATTVVQAAGSGLGQLTTASASFLVERTHLVDLNATYTSRLVLDAKLHEKANEFLGILNALDGSDQEQVSEDLFAIINLMKIGAYDVSMEATLAAITNSVGNYVPDSAEQSDQSTTAYLIESSESKTEESVYHWMKFDYAIGDDTFTFAVYLNESEFMDDYPTTTFGTIVYPIPVDLLIALAETPSTDITLSSLVTNASISAMANAMASNDNTGVIKVESYFTDTGAKITIGVCYNGKTPSMEEARNYVGADLLASTSKNEEFWSGALPDIFATDEFYYIPLWENYHTDGAVNIYRCIAPVAQARSDAKAYFDSYDEAYVDAHLELIQASGPDTYLAVVPAFFNNEDHDSLIKLYPDYIRDSSPLSMLGHVSDETKQYMTALANGMAQARLSNPPNMQEKYGYKWYSFVHGGVTHYILLESEYTAS